MNRHARIVLTGPGRGQVFIDGQEIKGVHTVHVSARAGADEANRLELHLHAMNIEIEGPMDVTTINSEAREYRAPHLPEPMPKAPPTDERYPEVFAWWPVRLHVIRPEGEPENHWPHLCWSPTGRWAWLRRVRYVDNVINGERHYFEGVDPVSRPDDRFSGIALQHWRGHGVDC